MTALIESHAWRPPHKTPARGAADEPCHYMNCRRPRRAHARAVSGKIGGSR